MHRGINVVVRDNRQPRVKEAPLHTGNAAHCTTGVRDGTLLHDITLNLQCSPSDEVWKSRNQLIGTKSCARTALARARFQADCRPYLPQPVGAADVRRRVGCVWGMSR